MRPVSLKNNILQYPLNGILGSEAHVRVLRLLIHGTSSPLGVPRIARLSGLTPAGARKAIHRLTKAGLLDAIGSGRTVQYGVHKKNPIYQALYSLFCSEHDRYGNIMSSVRRAVTGIKEIRDAWLDPLPADDSQPLQLIIVSDIQAISWIGRELRARLTIIEKDFDITIEADIFTRADAPKPVSDSIPITSQAGNNAPSRHNRPISHQEAEERALHSSKIIAGYLVSDPTLVNRAKHYLDQLVHTEQGTATDDILEWKSLLEAYSTERLKKLLTSRNSRADRLRQSSPFFAVLTPEQRDYILKAMKESP